MRGSDLWTRGKSTRWCALSVVAACEALSSWYSDGAKRHYLRCVEKYKRRFRRKHDPVTGRFVAQKG